MTAFVLDASAAIAWVSPDEVPPVAIEAAVQSGGAIGPALWVFETNNVLHTLRRRKRLAEADWPAASQALAAIPIELEMPSRVRIETEVVRLATELGLTVYDASYLELALRRRVPLATLDSALAAAAKKLKVKLV